MCVDVFIDVLAFVSHEFVPGYTVNPGIVQEHVEGVPAVMRGTLFQNAAGLQGSVETCPVSLLGDCSGAVVVDQALEIPFQAPAYHIIDC